MQGRIKIIGAGGRRRQRRADEHDNLALRRRISPARGQFGKRAGHHLLELLGELAAHRGRAIAQPSVQRRQRDGEARAGFVEGQRGRHVCQLGDHIGLGLFLGRQEAGEQETIGGQPGDG